MRLALVREGKALLYISSPEDAVGPKGLEPAWLDVFYNPVMVYNRDLGILLLRYYIEHLAPHRPIRAADPLAGTGVRSVRIALEVQDVERVHSNDLNPKAYRLITLNAQLNMVDDKIAAWNMDANALLAQLQFKLGEPLLYVDIDPFGSPAPYASQALRATGHRGLAAFTATDLGVLEGGKQRACRRKYWARCAKTPVSKELGLRVLLGYLARVAASNDKAVRPLLAYYADHYYRLYLLVWRGARAADSMLEESLGYAVLCREGGPVLVGGMDTATPQAGCVTVGPLWTGPLGDAGIAARLAESVETSYNYLPTRTRIKSLLQTLQCEYGLDPEKVYTPLPWLASQARVNTPSRDDFIGFLRENGVESCRTHFDPQGIRAEADWEDLVALVTAYWEDRGYGKR